MDTTTRTTNTTHVRNDIHTIYNPNIPMATLCEEQENEQLPKIQYLSRSRVQCRLYVRFERRQAILTRVT